jgi:hypothetical protein
MVRKPNTCMSCEQIAGIYNTMKIDNKSFERVEQLKYLESAIIIIIIIRKGKIKWHRRSQLIIFVIYMGNFLQHVSAEMGHRQVIHILKYTKKNYCTTRCLILNESSLYN